MLLYSLNGGTRDIILRVSLLPRVLFHNVCIAVRHFVLNDIIIFINRNLVVTRWQWLFYMYTEYEIGY